MTNAVLDCLKTRRSVRKYSDRPVEQEKLDAILEAATYAPTGMGKQSPVIVLVQDAETIQAISRMNAQVMGTDSDPFYGAPVLAMVFGHPDTAVTWLEDAALVTGNLLNAAWALGLGSYYINRGRQVFESEEGLALLKKWGLDESYKGVSCCILGYGEAPAPKERKADYIRKV